MKNNLLHRYIHNFQKEKKSQRFFQQLQNKGNNNHHNILSRITDHLSPLSKQQAISKSPFAIRTRIDIYSTYLFPLFFHPMTMEAFSKKLI